MRHLLCLKIIIAFPYWFEFLPAGSAPIMGYFYGYILLVRLFAKGGAVRMFILI
jgi:hypothetical protein